LSELSHNFDYLHNLIYIEKFESSPTAAFKNESHTFAIPMNADPLDSESFSNEPTTPPIPIHPPSSHLPRSARPAVPPIPFPFPSDIPVSSDYPPAVPLPHPSGNHCAVSSERSPYESHPFPVHPVKPPPPRSSRALCKPDGASRPGWFAKPLAEFGENDPPFEDYIEREFTARWKKQKPMKIYRTDNRKIWKKRMMKPVIQRRQKEVQDYEQNVGRMKKRAVGVKKRPRSPFKLEWHDE
jgi:hypothetical protein